MTRASTGSDERPVDMDRRGGRPELAWYGLVTLAAIAGEYLVLQLWRAELTVPFQIGGDATSAMAGVKGMVETGWLWTNPRLGAPGLMNLLDYPGSDMLHNLILKFLSLSGSAAMTLNLYYLLTFPLIALASAWVLRRLGISRSSALVASILYAFLPYHFYRFEQHIALSAYFMVPLLAYLSIGLFGEKPALLSRSENGDLVWSIGSRDSWIAVGVCLLGASSGVYYALFACFFIVVAAIYGWWHDRERLRLYAGAALVGIIFLGIALNVAPFALHRVSADANSAAVERNSTGTEVYSLRTGLLVLPVRGHRIELLARVHDAYVGEIKGVSKALDNEGDSVTLGILGTIGFLSLLFVLLFGAGGVRPHISRWPMLGGLAVLTGSALLLANSGMFGTVIGVVFGTIRAYNRIVVFVAFFSLLAVGVGLDWLGGKLGGGSRRWVIPMLAAAALVIGVFDQTSPTMVPAYAVAARRWESVGSFVARVERGLSDGAEVFQLPYVPYPENPPVVRMLDYDHFMPYLRSAKIHWSYGAVKGREAAAWNAETAVLPSDRLVPTLQTKGFTGIWVDCYGYRDKGAEIITGLTAATGAQPMLSDDGRYAFYRLP